MRSSKYDKAVEECANNPEKMSSFCTAEGQNLDQLYFDMLDKAERLIEVLDDVPEDTADPSRKGPVGGGIPSE